MVTGVISLARRPSCIAAAAFCWLQRANWSWSSRLIACSVARFSAVCGITSVPYSKSIFRLTKRHPMVVSYMACVRPNALSALPITKGERDMLSTPPAIIRSPSPELIAFAQLPTAFKPEPQSRLIVLAGTSGGSPANRVLMRATLRLSSPAWFAQPSIASSTVAQSTPVLRSIRAAIGIAARSSVRTGARPPP